MPASFNQSALEIIVNDLKNLKPDADNDARINYLKQKIIECGESITVSMDYDFENFDIIHEIENTIVCFLGKADQSDSNIRVHVSDSPIFIKADRIFVQLIFSALLSDVFSQVAQNTMINIHVTKNDQSCIVEMQESGVVFSDALPVKVADDNSLQALLGYRQIAEDMGGELLYSVANKNAGNYYRWKCRLG